MPLYNSSSITSSLPSQSVCVHTYMYIYSPVMFMVYRCQKKFPFSGIQQNRKLFPFHFPAISVSLPFIFFYCFNPFLFCKCITDRPFRDGEDTYCNQRRVGYNHLLPAKKISQTFPFLVATEEQKFVDFFHFHRQQRHGYFSTFFPFLRVMKKRKFPNLFYFPVQGRNRKISTFPPCSREMKISVLFSIFLYH